MIKIWTFIKVKYEEKFYNNFRTKVTFESAVICKNQDGVELGYFCVVTFIVNLVLGFKYFWCACEVLWSERIFGKLEGQSKATFAALFGLRAGGGVDLSAAYRYNQNMMEYYTCELYLK